MPPITFPSIDVVAIIPHLIVTGLACILMILDAVTRRGTAGRAGSIGAVISVVGYAAALISLAFIYDHRVQTGGDAIRFDYFAIFFLVVMLSIAILVVLVSANFVQLQGMSLLEYLVVLSFSVLGMMVVAVAGNLLMVFIGIELSSIAVYV